MPRLTPIILAVAIFMEQMDATVIATSLPAIAADIGADPISLKLALTAYFVSLAIFIPLSGWAADRFGATNIFRIAMGVFMVGSICCAFSDSLLAFVLSRFLQGIGGSMLVPVARLVLVRATPRNELVSAMAWLSIPALIGPLMGPPLGGFFATYLSWHWIFWINVPIGIIGIVLVTRFLPDTGGRNPRPIDLFGLMLTGTTFAGIIFGFSVLSLPAIPPSTGWLAIAIGGVAGILYLRHAKRTDHPILDPKMFALPLFRSAIVGGALFRLGIGALPFLMPLMLQLSFGMTPFEAGLVTCVATIGILLSKFGSSRILGAFGFPRTMLVTVVVAAAFLAVNGFFTPGTPTWVLMLALTVGGFVRSIFFTSINVLVFADVDEAHASQAAMINAVAQQLSIAAGVAIAGGALEIASSLRGGELVLADFHIAWFVVATVSLLAVIPFFRLPPDAGSDVSGHRAKPLPKAEPPL